MTIETWEEIADGLTRDGWSWGCLQACLDGRLRWVVDAHRGTGLPRYAVDAETKAGAFEKLRSILPAINRGAV